MTSDVSCLRQVRQLSSLVPPVRFHVCDSAAGQFSVVDPVRQVYKTQRNSFDIKC